MCVRERKRERETGWRRRRRHISRIVHTLHRQCRPEQGNNHRGPTWTETERKRERGRVQPRWVSAGGQRWGGTVCRASSGVRWMFTFCKEERINVRCLLSIYGAARSTTMNLSCCDLVTTQQTVHSMAKQLSSGCDVPPLVCRRSNIYKKQIFYWCTYLNVFEAACDGRGFLYP